MEKKARILYVEDDLSLSFVTRDNLELKGYSVDFCEDGMKALEMIHSVPYNLCILDVMLPRMDGFTLAGKIREKDPEIPILFLTARSAKEDRIHGLQLGADDYITKPFSIEELALKIEVFLKRSKIVSPKDKKPTILKLGHFTFDMANQQLIEKKKSHRLTHRESELLGFLVQNSNQIVKREEILLKVWGDNNYFASRSLDVFISRLRKILKTDLRIQIENIHNIGYRLRIE